MLVLSRDVGQKVVINGDIAATVSEIGRDFCNMQVSHRDGRLIGVVILRSGMSQQELAHGVWGHLAQVTPQGKVRIGLEGPKGITVVREG